jgi:tRNA G18 (ribose-2'-O)-methylase SpoU
MTKPQEHWVRHECGTDRIPFEEAQTAARLPFYAVLDHLRSAHNVGSIFRTADGARAAELLLCGYSPTPPHRHLAKTALGAVDIVPWSHHATAAEAIESLRAQSIQILAVEKTETSVQLYDFSLHYPVALVMGNEVDGLSEETIALCDATVHLPMHGLKNSLNVSVAFGIAMYEVLRRYETASVESS